MFGLAGDGDGAGGVVYAKNAGSTAARGFAIHNAGHAERGAAKRFLLSHEGAGMGFSGPRFLPYLLRGPSYHYIGGRICNVPRKTQASFTGRH